MPLGANFSSDYTNKQKEETLRCYLRNTLSQVQGPICCSVDPSGSHVVSQIYPVAITPSILLQTRLDSIPLLTPEEFALYPKVAVASSVRTESKRTQTVACAAAIDPSKRFAHYARYEPPLPCQPLPPTANMAGISLPSKRECNLYTA